MVKPSVGGSIDRGNRHLLRMSASWPSAAALPNTCALREDGTAVCWGNDDDGRSSPPQSERFTAISSGLNHTCALGEDGAAVCWGNDRSGRTSPPLTERFTAISSGSFHTCALREERYPRLLGQRRQWPIITTGG